MINKILNILLLISIMLTCGCSNEKQNTSDIKEDGSTPNQQEEINENKDKTSIDTLMPETEKNEVIDDSDESVIHYYMDIPQYVQITDYYCSVACLQSVMAYHGLYATQDELAKELHTDPITGTEYEDLARVATARIFPNGNGQYTSVIPSSNDERFLFEQRLLQDMKTNDPIFVSINNRIMYEDVPDQVHQVVVIGAIIENGSLNKIYFFDPSYIRQDATYGGIKSCTSDELWNAMINNPEPGYVY